MAGVEKGWPGDSQFRGRAEEEGRDDSGRHRLNKFEVDHAVASGLGLCVGKFTIGCVAL